MNPNLKTLLFRLAGALVVALAFSSVAAAFPTKPIRIVVPFGAGGATDQLARIIAVKLAPRLGQPVIVDNKPGAGTVLGIMTVKNADPDGHTLLLGGNSGVVQQALDKDVAFNILTDFSGVATVAEQPYLLIVHPAMPAKNFEEFAALLKSSPDKYNYASAGVGSSTHFTAELMLSMMGAKAVHVPYNSSATSPASVAAGETQFSFESPVTAKPLIAAGKVRALAVSASARSASVPELPTINEAGLKGYAVTGYFAMLVPAKTPRSITELLSREIRGVMSDAEVKAKVTALGLDEASSTPEALDRRNAAELARWTKLVQELKIKK